jgi:hypothetical protein
MPISTLISPTVGIMDVAEARAQIRYDGTDQDGRLKRAIASYTTWAENVTQRSYISRRLLLTLDAFPGPTLIGVPAGIPFSLPGSAVLLEQGPLLSVQSIKYTDMGGTLQTLPTTEYVVEMSSLPGRVTPQFGKIWPVTLPQMGAVQITYDVGHATQITADTTADTITVKGIWKTLVVGDLVRFSVSGDSTAALPAPLSENTDYYIRSVVSTGVYTLSTTVGGALLDLTTTGTGTSYIGVVPPNVVDWTLYRVGTAFNHRESEIAMDRGTVFPIEWLDRLLDESAVPLY